MWIPWSIKLRPRLSLVKQAMSISNRPAFNIVKPGNISPCRQVPEYILKPFYVANPEAVPKYYPSEELKSPKDMDNMRNAGVIAAAILQYAGRNTCKNYYEMKSRLNARYFLLRNAC